MPKLVFVLNLICAAAAFGAALFWFLSAAGELPAMVTYWIGVRRRQPVRCIRRFRPGSAPSECSRQWAIVDAQGV
jgi:hypothetical protein